LVKKYKLDYGRIYLLKTALVRKEFNGSSPGLKPGDEPIETVRGR